MPPDPPRPRHHCLAPDRERGQAAVELVAVLPLLGVLVALAWQAVIAGHAAWAATAAARAAARAAAIGQDPAAVARRRLGPALAAGASVRSAGDGRVTVSVAIPRVLEALPLGRVSGESSFQPQDGS
jgi:Flp pilus assembly protein TadG